MGPIPAPVATRRRELKSGAKVRKLDVGGARSQRCDGGLARTLRVQSPAALTMILAVPVPSAAGIVANACHSASGQVLKRQVDVYRISA